MKNRSFILLLLSIISILPLLLYGLLVLVFRCFRCVVGLHLKQKYGGKAQFLASNDATLAYQDIDENPMVKDGSCTFKGRVDISELQKHVGDRIANKKNYDNSWKYPKCRFRLCREYGYLFWLPETNFRIEDHVILYNGMQPKNQNELYRVFAELANSPLPKNLSPWCFYLINLEDDYVDLNPGPHFVIYIKDHHALCDGFGFVQILSRNFFDEMAKYDIGSLKIPQKFSYVDYLTKVLKLLAFGPGLCVMSLMTPPDNNILYGKKLSGKKRFGHSALIDINRIKRIKNATGTTVNDVIASCVCGGLRSHFLKEGVNPPSVHYLIPVSLRNFKNEPKMQNQISALIFSDATDKPTAMERLLTSQKNMNILKNSETALALYFMAAMGANILPAFICDKIRSLLRGTCMFSNVPGPTEAPYYNGRELERIAFFGVATGQTGLAISVISYKGDVQIALKVDEVYMDKQEIVDQFLDDVVKEIEDLEKHATT